MTQFYNSNTSKNSSLLFNKDSSTYFSNPNRVPFTDITQQLNHNNYNNQKNQNIILENNFNDFSNNENKFMFLKKKSHGENLDYYEEYDQLNNYETKNIKLNRKNENKYTKKNSNNCNINEEEEQTENKENYDNGNTQNKQNIFFSFEQILNQAICEKKEFDKNERDRKKAIKMKRLKFFMNNKKNIMENSNGNIYNHGMHSQESYYSNKDVNSMNLD